MRERPVSFRSVSCGEMPVLKGVGRKIAAAQRIGLFLAMTGMMSGCSWIFGITPQNEPDEHPVLSLYGGGSKMLSGYVGNVVADEPHAALAAMTVLQRGGNAADAAAALGLALSVTLPSRASLGSGGACVAWRPEERAGRAFLFMPTGDAPADPMMAGAKGRADRPASIPMLVRGLFLMQLRYGSVDFAETAQPAITLARNGIEVGAQLAADLAVVQAPLLADEGARKIFGRSDGTVLKAGDIFSQRYLTGTLERIRSAGSGDLYTGALAQVLVASNETTGAGLTMGGLRSAVPIETAPLTVTVGNVRASFVPPPADGGYGMAVAWKASEGGQTTGNAGARAIAGWRAGEGRSSVAALTEQAQALLDSGKISGGSGMPNLPASTSFAVVDRKGEAVACAVSMNNLFGTGRVAGSTGIVLGASAAHRPRPILPAGIAHQDGEFLAAATASGQADAADAAGAALSGALAGDVKATTSSGRANAISCRNGLPGGNGHCFGWVDPRGSGYATGSDHN
ncbi:MAG: gamma-glutamyltransferase [Acetobacter aceti]|uniref:Gamma-glutamyltranspeptidase n=1 Tax=Acetobacter aceti TaxID=435 RepID=A0A1U9KHK3_ACEAC|nr:gamma-glutamyltransferase [Acetobacter aceti]AQS85281.1 gamma-glutamyltranspeptidase [Acetobacter aceti]